MYLCYLSLARQFIPADINFIMRTYVFTTLSDFTGTEGEQNMHALIKKKFSSQNQTSLFDVSIITVLQDRHKAKLYHGV